MSYTTSNTVKIFALAGLIAFFIGVPLGNIHSAFAETEMDTDIVMTIDTNQNFEVDPEIFDSLLIVVTAAFLATDGNLEVMVLGENTVCLSAQNGSCMSKATPQNPDMAMKVENKKIPVRIMTAYDQ